MASVLHSSLSGANLHDPKGVGATAIYLTYNVGYGSGYRIHWDADGAGGYSNVFEIATNTQVVHFGNSTVGDCYDIHLSSGYMQLNEIDTPNIPTAGDVIRLFASAGTLKCIATAGAVFRMVATAGSGTVYPVSSTDHAFVRWNGTDGDAIQDSDSTLSDAEVLTIGASGHIVLPETSKPTITGENVGIYANTDLLYCVDSAGTAYDLTKQGDVVGPGASVVDNTLARFNGTGGLTIQSSGITVDDNEVLTLGTGTGHIVFPETAAPATPGGETVLLYASAGNLYQRDSAGTSTSLAGGGGGGWTTLDYQAKTNTTYTLTAGNVGADVLNGYTGSSDTHWTLPATPTSGDVVRIVNTVAYTLTVDPGSGDSISGSTSGVAIEQYESLTLAAISAAAWLII